ncbi:thioredoxin-like protein [Chitinophaga dinghuensis]|uniref:Thioredoxin-like protein n=1 Tax=Chitinophaga dinghuensis TaxID=1539050 RepID=A0A327VYV5_9BACT|nr:TlpA disulfide reductase family protein [Chitinophaga dinghuensis]RAJ80075.1 thioredoxin-like protein [Chitinophaga dinghuensis]
MNRTRSASYRLILFLLLAIPSLANAIALKPIIVIVHNQSEKKISGLPSIRGENGEPFNFFYQVGGKIEYLLIPKGDKPVQIDIHPDHPMIELVYLYKQLDKISYFLSSGDTLYIDIVDGKPNAYHSNAITTHENANLEILWRERIAPGDYLSVIKLKESLLRKKDPLSTPELEHKANNEINAIYPIIDSLVRNKSMLPGIAALYRIKYDFIKRAIGDDLDKMNDEQLKALMVDSLLRYDFYRRFIFRSANGRYGKLNKVSMGNTGTVGDFRPGYDAVATSTIYEGSARELLLKASMTNIVKYATVDQIDEYLKKFERDLQDKQIYTDFVEKYELKSKVSNDIMLEAVDGSGISLMKLLERYNGTPVYIDWWASWCVPCIAAMPASKNLVQQYQGKAIVFLYLSFDDNIEKWKEKIKALNIPNAVHYRVANVKRSRMLDKLKIPPIPRYMLYDKNSRLVHENAPSPESTEVLTLLNGII